MDDASGGECKQTYKDSKSGFTDCDYGVNCQPCATEPNEYQTVYVDNELDSPDEEAKIKQSLEQYLRCGQANCLNASWEIQKHFLKVDKMLL